MPADTGSAIEVKDLVRRYGEREALAGVSVAVGEGETLAVFGPNGAGKTTFLRVLATLLLPHGGAVQVLGHDLPDDAQPVRAAIGLVAHDPLLYRDLSGRENLRFYARLYGLADAEDRIDELLDSVAMARRADDPVRELSRGMVQRIAVCRAVLHRPQLLLLDEPHAGLDPEAAALVEPLIGRASRTTRVLVTHDVEQGLEQADRVLGLRDGLMALDRPGADATQQQVRALYREGQV
ncbi:MAG: ABC transporter ATP-binding protein [Solirubrobacterales bacterium]